MMDARTPFGNCHDVAQSSSCQGVTDLSVTLSSPLGNSYSSSVGAGDEMSGGLGYYPYPSASLMHLQQSHTLPPQLEEPVTVHDPFQPVRSASSSSGVHYTRGFETSYPYLLPTNGANEVTNILPNVATSNVSNGLMATYQTYPYYAPSFASPDGLLPFRNPPVECGLVGTLRIDPAGPQFQSECV